MHVNPVKILPDLAGNVKMGDYYGDKSEVQKYGRGCNSLDLIPSGQGVRFWVLVVWKLVLLFRIIEKSIRWEIWMRKREIREGVLSVQ